MPKAVKRRSVRSQPKRVKPPPRAWSQPLGEAVILILIVAVPIAINRTSLTVTDVKEVVLGLGAVLGISLWLVAGLAQGRLTWVRTPLIPLALAYFAWAIAGTFYSGYWWVSMGEAGRLGAGVTFFLLTVLCIRSLPQVRRIVAAACLASVPVSIYAFCQAVGRDFIQWGNPTLSRRVFSFLGNPTYLGGFVMLIVPVAVAAAWSWARDRRAARRPLWVAVLAFFVAAIVMMLMSLYLSFTISGAIGLGLGAAFALALLVISGGRRMIRTAAVAVLAAVVFGAALGPVVYRHMPAAQQDRVRQVIHLQDPFAAERQLHWRTAFKLFRQQPLVGKGYGGFRIYSLEQMTAEWYSQQDRSNAMFTPGYAHNEYLQALADTGVIGGALFLALLATFGVTIIRLAMRHPEAEWRRLGLAIAAALTAFLFQNAVGVTFHQTGAAMFFWLWMGVAAVGAATLPRPEGKHPRGPVGEWRPAQASLPAAGAAAVAAAGILVVLSWMSITPVMANVRVRIAQAVAARKHYRATIVLCDAALDLCPYSSMAYYVKAYAAGELADYRTATEAYRAALKLAPANATLYYNLGVSYKRLHQYREAEQCFREAIRLMPIKQHYGSLAETLYESGKLEEADQQARHALEVDPADASLPHNAEVASLLAKVQAARRGHPLETTMDIPELQAALQLEPDNVSYLNRLTVALLNGKRYEEALVMAQRWAQADPAAPMAQADIGVCSFHLGRFADARDAFLRQLELDPTNLRAHLNLVYAYGRLHDEQNALAQVKYLVEHGGDSPEGRKAKQMLGGTKPQPQPLLGE